MKRRKQIGDAFSGYLANFQTVYHINGQQTVTLKGDSASGISYCFVTLIGSANGKKMKTSMGVYYNDDFVRRDGKIVSGEITDPIWRTWNDPHRVKAFMTSIIQIGENFFCADRDGIFRSSYKGKTWKLLLPSIDGKVFILFVSGNVIYTIPSKGGC